MAESTYPPIINPRNVLTANHAKALSATATNTTASLFRFDFSVVSVLKAGVGFMLMMQQIRVRRSNCRRHTAKSHRVRLPAWLALISTRSIDRGADVLSR